MTPSAARALSALRPLRINLGRVLRAPQIAIFLPAVCLGAFQVWGESGLLAVGLGTPLLLALIHGLAAPERAPDRAGLPLTRAEIEAALQAAIDSRAATRRVTAAFAIGLDDFRELGERLGHRGMEAVLRRMEERLAVTLRSSDRAAYLDAGMFAVALTPTPRLDLETLMQIATRLQAALAEPIVIDALSLRVTAAIGFCHSDRLPAAGGPALLDAAEAAMTEAQRQGARSIRAYSADMHRRRTIRHRLRDRVSEAVEAGAFRAWFQPQISTDTGRLTGFEALARWPQADGSVVAPRDFLPALAEAGLLDRLGETMLYQSLTALRAWDRAGVLVPNVGLNLSAGELRNPMLLERMMWELDRFGIAPERLTVEVLESVIAGAPEDTTCRNIHGLAKLGCKIDLDDFGTGNASITTIRRFSVNRLKIDRSFVRAVDIDPDQQRMMAAILTMAEHMGLDTLAEGVESAGEHALLCQLGCKHVQGFATGVPMPYEDTIAWIAQHDQRVARAPQVGRNTG